MCCARFCVQLFYEIRTGWMDSCANIKTNVIPFFILCPPLASGCLACVRGLASEIDAMRLFLRLCLCVGESCIVLSRFVSFVIQAAWTHTARREKKNIYTQRSRKGRPQRRTRPDVCVANGAVIRVVSENKPYPSRAREKSQRARLPPWKSVSNLNERQFSTRLGRHFDSCVSK